MLPAPRNYAVWPSVVPADKECEIVIYPTEKAFMFFENEEYNITVIDVNGDEPNYYSISAHKYINVVAHDGVLKFSYTFESEGEHTLALSYKEKKVQDLSVFSLYEDLYALTPLRGDFHGHSYRSDGKRDPAALAGHYREQGYDFFSLTDHNRFYPGGEIDETYEGVELGIVRIPGEEVHTPINMIHVVHVGGKESVADLYVKNREQYEKEIAEYTKQVPADIDEAYIDRYAKISWATDRIHERGGIAIFAHPYWIPGASKMYNVHDDLARLLLKCGRFDAYELIGGVTQPELNRSVALWGDVRAEGTNIPVVGSSDIHKFEKSDFFPYYFTICFADGKNVDSIVDSVRRGNSVAVEATGYEYDIQYRCYGSLRLVTYAHFLLKNYFPQLQRICQGEGVAMRAYAMNDADASLIESQVAQTNKFTARFFGKLPPKLPDQKMIEFEERWRKVQLDGPHTKGSGLDLATVSRQI